MFKTAAEAITALVATVGLIYVLGGVALALRLGFVGIPWQTTVAQLPREYVETVGLSEIVAPGLIAGMTVVALLIVLSPIRALEHDALSRKNNKWVVGLTLGTSIVIVAPAFALAVDSYGWEDKLWAFVPGVLLAIVSGAVTGNEFCLEEAP